MNYGLLFLRLVAGVTLFLHGWFHFFKGGRIAGTARWFQSMGMKPNGTVHAWLASLTEIGAGLLMVAGFLTPLAAAGFVGLLLVAAWTVHRHNGYRSVNDGWEYVSVLAGLAVGIAMCGPGRFSVDRALDLPFADLITTRSAVAVRFLLSAGVGVAAGVLLLVCCYRPPAKEADES